MKAKPMSNKIFSNLLSFDKMISEQIIKLVYYVGLLLIALGFIASFFKSFSAGIIGFIPAVFMAIIGAALSILLWRVFCECIIILFRLYARLGDINQTLGGKNIEPAIPGDEALKAAREAALKAKSAAMERADAIKGKVVKEDVDLNGKPVASPAAPKPAGTPPKRPASAKSAPKPTVKKTATKKPAAKKPASKKAPVSKSPAKKVPTRKTPPKKD